MLSNASLVGFNKIAAGSGENVVTSTMKADGGTLSQSHGIPTANQGAFDGNSNDMLTNSLITGSTPVGNTIMYGMNGSGVGAPDHFRKLVEVNVVDPIREGGKGDLHTKLADTELRWGDQTPGGAMKHLIDGSWVNSSGVATTPVGTGVVYKNIVAGSGDIDALQGRGRPQNYHYRNNLDNTRMALPVRTQ